jgi:hypothetical protein
MRKDSKNSNFYKKNLEFRSSKIKISKKIKYLEFKNELIKISKKIKI